MTIYKIRFWVDQTNGRGRTTREQHGEEIIIDNLETAKQVYNEALNRCKYSAQFKGNSGKCELFIPHLHENGTLAYWPDDEQYIKQYEF